MVEHRVSPISDILSNQAVFRVVDFFLHCLPISSLHSFGFFFFFALIRHNFKTFSLFMSELDMQRSKTLWLSACFRIVKVFGLPMGIIVQLEVL